jgi:hypothetical protein
MLADRVSLVGTPVLMINSFVAYLKEFGTYYYIMYSGC